MAALAASDVSYTMLNRRKEDSSKKKFNVQIAVGDGVKTYPAGGIPLTIAKLGCPVSVESLIVYDLGGSAYQAEYDQSNKKLRLFSTELVGGLRSEATGVAIPAQSMKAEVTGF